MLPSEYNSSGGESGSGSSVGAGANSSPGSGSTGTASGSGTTQVPSTNPANDVPDDTLAEQMAANLALIGGLMNPDSLQPVAPQAPGNVLSGRFGASASMFQNPKFWVIVAAVAIVGFYLWKRNKG